MPVESPLRSRNGEPFGLIETLRYDPGQGCVRASAHLDRIERSARLFRAGFDRQKAAVLLASIQSESALRVRLFLDPQGGLSLSTHPFFPVPDGAIWTVAIARTRLSSADPLLAHKTSLRSTYDAARAEFSASEADEVLLENEHDYLCEGAITSLFVEKNGKLVTPRLSHGLLRGVLRQELLDKGDAIEGDIIRADLESCPFMVGNSLRGLIPARLGNAS